MFKKKLPDILQINNQKEFDAIPDDYKGRIEIVGRLERIVRSFDDAYIVVSGNAVIESCSGNAVIKYCYDNAVIESCYDNAVIKSCSGNAVINAFGLASILSAMGSVIITTHGINIVRYFDDEKNLKLKLSKKTTVIKLKKQKPTAKLFCEEYPVETKGKNAILYKAVHKIDGRYFSDRVNSFEYIIGETKEHALGEEKESCGAGLHVAHLRWAVLFGKYWEDEAILECSVPLSKIFVGNDCDGKVRTSELKVLREVPKSEW